MKTLNKFLKIMQAIAKIDFKNKSVNPIESESLQALQFEEASFSTDSDSLLFLINAEENEFLFI